MLLLQALKLVCYSSSLSFKQLCWYIFDVIYLLQVKPCFLLCKSSSHCLLCYSFPCVQPLVSTIWSVQHVCLVQMGMLRVCYLHVSSSLALLQELVGQAFSLLSRLLGHVGPCCPFVSFSSFIMRDL
jgi:hypothetical protein